MDVLLAVLLRALRGLLHNSNCLDCLPYGCFAVAGDEEDNRGHRAFLCTLGDPGPARAALQSLPAPQPLHQGDRLPRAGGHLQLLQGPPAAGVWRPGGRVPAGRPERELESGASSLPFWATLKGPVHDHRT